MQSAGDYKSFYSVPPAYMLGAEMKREDTPQPRGTLPFVLSESIATNTIIYSEHNLQKQGEMNMFHHN